MAALDFPASPTVGQIYVPGGAVPNYAWDGTTWNAIYTPPKMWTSATPPVAPLDGDLWWASDTGILYVRYNDGNSSQWVVTQPATDMATLDTRYALGPGTAGAFKVSSGVLASAAAQIDIPLPVGYFSFDLLLSQFVPVTDAQNLNMRFSLDGSTFIAANYVQAYNISLATGTNAPGGSGSIAAIAIGANQNTLATVGLTGRVQLYMPPASNIQAAIVDSQYYNGTTYARFSSMGGYTGGFGPAQIARLLYATGNIAAGAKWQLNGMK